MKKRNGSTVAVPIILLVFSLLFTSSSRFKIVVRTMVIIRKETALLNSSATRTKAKLVVLNIRNCEIQSTNEIIV